MKTTIFGVLLDVTPEQDTILRRLMRKCGFMLRFAFKRWVEGLSNVGALERHLSSDSTPPLRYAKDAVQEAQDLIRARHQAMQDGLTLWTTVRQQDARTVDGTAGIPAYACSPHCGTRTEAGAPRRTPGVLL